MSEHELFLMIDYDVTGDIFCFRGNIKEERIADIIADFVRFQMGAGEDKSEREEHDLYQLNLKLDLSFDKFTTSSNCGNLGLRDGILMHFLNKLNEKKEE